MPAKQMRSLAGRPRRCPLGPWAAARRSSHNGAPPRASQTERHEASSPSRPRPGWPVCALVQSLASRSRSARHPLPPHHKPPGQGHPSTAAGFWTVRGHPSSSETGRGWSPGCGLACRAKALVHLAGGRPCPSAAGAEVAVSGPQLACQLFLLFLVTLVLAFTASRPDVTCLVKCDLTFGTERTGALPPVLLRKTLFNSRTACGGRCL